MKECKNKKNNAKELGRTKQLSWVSHSLSYSFHVQPLIIHINFSGSGADCSHVTGWQKSDNEGSFLQKQNGLHPYVPQSDTQA